MPSNAQNQKPQAPVRQRVLDFVTPDQRDIVFKILVDSREPQYATPPAFGDPYHDNVAYPNHKFVASMKADGDMGDQGWRFWYYAADRATQEAYNAEMSYPYGERFPQYKRTYVLPREDYAPLPGLTPDPLISGALLSGEEMKRMDGVLDSLYVAVVRTYQRFPDLTNADDAEAMKRMGFSIEYPWGKNEAPRVTWTFQQAITAYRPAIPLSPCPVYSASLIKLVQQDYKPDGPGDEFGKVTRVYEPLPTPELDGEEAKADTLPPEKFLPQVIYETAEQIVPAGTDAATGVLDSKVQPIDANRSKKTTIIASATPVPLDGEEFDPDTGDVFPVTQAVVPAGTGGSGVNGSGFFSEVTPFNTRWSIKTTRKATGLTTERSWPDIVTYPWPAVVTAINIYSLTKGGNPVRAIVYPVYKTYGYNGPCRATIREKWTADPPTLVIPTNMRPTPIIFQGAFYNVNVGPCLHPAFNFLESAGTDHPDYDPFVHTETVQATNFIDWPSTIIASRNSVRYKGGYLLREMEVYKPSA